MKRLTMATGGDGKQRPPTEKTVPKKSTPNKKTK
jgi:hypothetical protein